MKPSRTPPARQLPKARVMYVSGELMEDTRLIVSKQRNVRDPKPVFCIEDLPAAQAKALVKAVNTEDLLGELTMGANERARDFYEGSRIYGAERKTREYAWGLGFDHGVRFVLQRLGLLGKGVGR